MTFQWYARLSLSWFVAMEPKASLHQYHAIAFEDKTLPSMMFWGEQDAWRINRRRNIVGSTALVLIFKSY